MTVLYSPRFLSDQSCIDYLDVHKELQQRWVNRAKPPSASEREALDAELRDTINVLEEAARAKCEASVHAQGMRLIEYWSDNNEVVVDLIDDETIDLLVPPPVELPADPEQSMFEP